jgi:hypothetical protein
MTKQDKADLQRLRSLLVDGLRSPPAELADGAYFERLRESTLKRTGTQGERKWPETNQ